MKRFVSNNLISRVAAMKQFIIVYAYSSNDLLHAKIAAVVSLHDLGSKRWNNWVKGFHRKYKNRSLCFHRGDVTIYL